MVFDMRGLHLGDVLLALPAMRRGDAVVAHEYHRVPGAPVTWLDTGRGLCIGPHGHRTSAWLQAASRDPIRHQLLPRRDKDLLVFAPDVALPRKRWGRWEQLAAHLPHAVHATAALARGAWMALLNRAHTVVCPDTGTAHMADALGCPRVVGLYGRDFETFAPYWDRSHCVVRNGMDAITVDDVLESIHG